MRIGLTVCIPAYNEAINLEALFHSLSESDIDLFDYEILLCDSGSNDGTRELFDRWVKVLNLQLIVTPGANASQNLNAGIMSSSNSIFCRIDSRARVAADYFSVSYRYLVDKSDRYCAIGPSVQVIPRSPQFVPSVLAKFFMSPFLMGPSKWKRSVFYRDFEGEVDTIYLGLFWTKDLRAIGGFDTSLTRKQDIDLLQRLQASTDKKLFNSCNLRAIYVLKHDTLKEICNRAYIQGVYAGLYSTPIRPAHVLPATCLGAFVAVSVVYPALGLFLIGLYTALITIVGFLEVPRFLSIPISLVTFPAVHLSFVVGNIRGLVSKLLLLKRKSR
ncbi:glycosyltransferase [Porticoccaceae bacterium]|nr:glycosyltransferase [Porticoccaceae bacterium]